MFCKLTGLMITYSGACSVVSLTTLLKRGCCGDTPCCVGTRLKLRINDFKRVPTQHGLSPQHPRFKG